MGITGIILNWKRPQNVARILAGWREGGIVTDAIVWNNNPDAPLPPHEWATVINCSRDLGLHTRFAAGCLARTDCLLIQDDDLELSPDTLQTLHQSWLADPDVIHGVFGRRPARDGSYRSANVPSGEAPIVLTRALMAHRRLAAEFWRHLPRFEEIQAGGNPYGNGEDILFSFVAMKTSGRLNRVRRMPVTELPDYQAISGRPGHGPHRSRLTKACADWLAEETEWSTP